MIKNATDIIIAFAALALPVVAQAIGAQLEKHKRAQTIVSLLQPLARDAVIAVEQWNKTAMVDGKSQKGNAVMWVRDNLSELGYDDVDWDMVANAVEGAYKRRKDNEVQ